MKPIYQSFLSGIFLFGQFLSQCSSSDSDIPSPDIENPPNMENPPVDATPSVSTHNMTVKQKENQSSATACNQQGWCFSSPAPQGNLLHSVWTSPSGKSWAAGNLGTLLSYDGATWTPITGLPNETKDQVFYGVWGNNDSDVWVVGSGGLILHFDGKIWTLSPSGVKQPLYGIWGTDSSHIWAVGESHTDSHILYFDGKTWIPQPNVLRTDLLKTISGSSSDNIWAVGNNGIVVHYDGNAWSLVDLKQEISLSGVLTFSKNDVWISGTDQKQGYLSHFDGKTWTPITLSTGNKDSKAPSGYSQMISFDASGKDFWLLGDAENLPGVLFHKTEAGWSQIQLDPAISLWGISGNQNGLWLVGQQGIVLSWDGKDFWQYAGSKPSNLNPHRIWGIEVQGAKTLGLWGLAKAGIVQKINGKWGLQFPVPDGVELLNIQGTENTIWAVGRDTSATPNQGVIFQFNGLVWNEVKPNGNRPSAPLRTIAIQTDSKVYLGGEGGLLLYLDGTTWTKAVISDKEAGTFQDFFVRENALWLLGEGAIYFADTSKSLDLVKKDIPGLWMNPIFRSIWGTGSEVWVTVASASEPASSALYHYDGINDRWNHVDLSSITQIPGHSDLPNLQGIWGSGPNDLWMVGSMDNASRALLGQTIGVIILHFDGKIWTKQDSFSDASGPFQIIGIIPDKGKGPDPINETLYITSPSVCLVHTKK